MRNGNYLELPCIEVNQPLGSFYITKIKAKDLLKISYSEPLRVIDEEGRLFGNQREIKTKRLKEIANFISTSECAFPNSIILAANYNIDGLFCENEEIRWRIQKDSNDNINLIIPTDVELSSIIDGQHRLNGFSLVESQMKEMDLLCSIYIDLPRPYQAYIFATINFNQIKVDRSLAYELFGYNIEEEEPETWTPEKLAVFLTRKLNIDDSSSFKNHIIVSAQDDNLLLEKIDSSIKWKVSTATIVDGILKLISSNPKKDRDLMHKKTINNGRTRKDLTLDNSPFRSIFIESNDIVIYTSIQNYFNCCNELLFQNSPNTSYIKKTIGIQALFDVLKEISTKYLAIDKDISLNYYKKFISPVSMVDFSDNYFQASGIGRSRIKKLILYANKLLNVNDEEKSKFDELLNNENN